MARRPLQHHRPSDGRPLVVLVHGLLMTGLDLALLARRLRRCGFDTRIFIYATVGGDMDESVERLHRRIAGWRPHTLHLVGHSLGGLVIRLLLARHPDLPAGRVVTLGTPHNGSAVAARLGRRRWGRLLLGRSAATLNGAVPVWDGARPLGSIAGRLALGAGTLVRGLPRPNDGAVAVAETRLAGAADHLVLPASHLGLLLSAEAARQTCRFLQSGRFEHTVTPSAVSRLAAGSIDAV